MIRLMVTAVVAVAVGFCAGYQIARPGAPAATTADGAGGRAVDASRGRPSTLTPADLEFLKRELVSAIAQSIAAAPSPVELPTVTPGAETDETVAAGESLQNVVAGAVAVGAWTSEDALALTSLMRRASPSAAKQALRTLVGAINDQRLRVEGDGVAF